MYMTDYLSVYNENSNLLLEIALPNMGGMNDFAQQNSPPQPDPNDGMVEFEPIKKYLLFNKLKELRTRLHKSKLNRSDPNVQSIYDFIDLVIDFYNVFSYSDSKKLIDRISDMIISANRLMVSTARLQLDPELDPIKVQQQQQQQQQADAEAEEQQKQQANADFMTNIQQQNAKLDLITKKLNLKNLRKQTKLNDTELAKQSHLKDRLANIQQKNAELDLVAKRLNLGMQLHNTHQQLKDGI